MVSRPAHHRRRQASSATPDCHASPDARHDDEPHANVESQRVAPAHQPTKRETGRHRRHDRKHHRKHGCHRPVSRVLSVHRGAPDGHSSRRVVTNTLQQPTRGSMPCDILSRRAVSHRLFGLAPTGVYRATPVAGRAVGSYPTLSPLPPSRENGGLLSVALSVARSSRRMRPGVTWRSALWSPDFPRNTGVAMMARSLVSRPSGR